MIEEVLFFQAGYCTHPEFVAIAGGSFKSRRFPALVALLKHPGFGYILFDTGYSSRFYEEVKHFPYSVYGRVTPVYFREEESIIRQLAKRGIAANDISYVILSHLHADHIAGTKDFPKATFITMKKAYDDVKDRTGFSAVRKAFIPNLLPADFTRRLRYLEDQSKVNNPFGDGSFETGYDLFGDGEIVGIELSGHAKGQFGITFETKEQGRYFLIADACWLSETYRSLRFPAGIASLIMDDSNEFKKNVYRLHELHTHRPELKIIPTHCDELFSKEEV